MGEFNYSVTEALFISVAFYSALKKRIFLFAIIVSLAVLNRESGFVVLSLWVLFNGLYLKNFYKNFYLLLPPVVFIIANFSMLQCLFQDNFLMSRSSNNSTNFEKFSGPRNRLSFFAFDTFSKVNS